MIEQVRERIRYRHYSYRTEQAYVEWVKRFVRFNGLRHPREMGREAIESFLNHLAVERNVATSTHNQALSALLFLYGQVLGVELPWLGAIGRPKRPPRRPVVLTPEEVRRVLAHLDGFNELMARLLYGTGMRLMDCVRLRAESATANTPIIAITFFALSGDEQKAKEAGATAYLAKPYSPFDLLNLIRKLLPEG